MILKTLVSQDMETEILIYIYIIIHMHKLYWNRDFWHNRILKQCYDFYNALETFILFYMKHEQID